MLKAEAILDRDFSLGESDPRLFGAFVEHLGRCVYGGIFEPGHPRANARGFRQDVLSLVRELGATVVRYPGGNFVSGYRWEDGVGPPETRRRRKERAWRSTETNRFGTDEFMAWCRAAGTEPMLAVNLGTRGATEARDLVDYCNSARGTVLSERRRANGHYPPHGVKLWCLGNEMDGPWQIGAKTADAYGRLAADAAKLMRGVDPAIELVACGSSHQGMPGFGAWEEEVLRHALAGSDYISLHCYFDDCGGDRAAFLAWPDRMARHIEAVTALCDAAAVKQRSRRKIMLSFNEWNVWYRTRMEAERLPEGWPEAPPLLEERYSMADALVVGGALITLLNHADRVRIACLAQLVNVIAPIVAEPGGPAWRQTIFHPFALTARHGKGRVLRVARRSPSYEAGQMGEAPYLQLAAVQDAATDGLAIFAVNRSLEEPMTLDVALRGFSALAPLETIELHHDDLDAGNSATRPDEVAPVAVRNAQISGDRLSVELRPASWNLLRLERVR
jgi:alpha-N-arabinofuranosidase